MAKLFALVVLANLALLHTVSSDEICCDPIGCFNDEVPFDNIALPICLDRVPPKYLMHTRQNRDTGEAFNHTTVPSVFDPSVMTVFLVHGWNSNGNSAWMRNTKNAFLDRDNFNVVIVDWAGGATNPNYFQAASNTRSYGAYTGLVISSLVASGGSAALMWCAGHSLGSHHCGHAGMRATPMIQRVTGLDPAGPWFQGKEDKTVGINPTSARFVDIIHTDQALGQLNNLGHIDFYPAGGAEQPGCFNQDFPPEDPDVEPSPLDDSCDHSRAPAYFEQSIRQDCFLSRRKCSNFNDIPGSCIDCTCGSDACASMGYSADTACQREGLFFVDVTSASPYCPSL